MEIAKIPSYAELNTDSDVNYLCNICDNKEYTIKYITEKKTIVIRNCDKSGNLLDLKLPKSRFAVCDPWVLLSIKKFRDNGKEFDIPVCKICNDYMNSLAIDQKVDNFKTMLCNHAKIAINIIRDFDLHILTVGSILVKMMTRQGWR